MAADSIKLEQVETTVTCLICEKDSNVTMKRPQFDKICQHCGKGMFHFRVEGVGGKKASVRIHATFEYPDTSTASINAPVRITD